MAKCSRGGLKSSRWQIKLCFKIWDHVEAIYSKSMTSNCERSVIPASDSHHGWSALGTSADSTCQAFDLRNTAPPLIKSGAARTVDKVEYFISPTRQNGPRRSRDASRIGRARVEREEAPRCTATQNSAVSASSDAIPSPSNTAASLGPRHQDVYDVCTKTQQFTSNLNKRELCGHSDTMHVVNGEWRRSLDRERVKSMRPGHPLFMSHTLRVWRACLCNLKNKGFVLFAYKENGLTTLQLKKGGARCRDASEPARRPVQWSCAVPRMVRWSRRTHQSLEDGAASSEGESSFERFLWITVCRSVKVSTSETDYRAWPGNKTQTCGGNSEFDSSCKVASQKESKLEYQNELMKALQAVLRVTAPGDPPTNAYPYVANILSFRISRSPSSQLHNLYLIPYASHRRHLDMLTCPNAADLSTVQASSDTECGIEVLDIDHAHAARLGRKAGRRVKRSEGVSRPPGIYTHSCGVRVATIPRRMRERGSRVAVSGMGRAFLHESRHATMELSKWMAASIESELVAGFQISTPSAPIHAAAPPEYDLRGDGAPFKSPVCHKMGPQPLTQRFADGRDNLNVWAASMVVLWVHRVVVKQHIRGWKTGWTSLQVWVHNGAASTYGIAGAECKLGGQAHDVQDIVDLRRRLKRPGNQVELGNRKHTLVNLSIGEPD
ncbi:hypothetical protein C8R45DRAFT_1081549 [Mycena sanguinolenta]|nr:hypothetical protein C8R45DRAFT_1081549 [Mycena sanguinolenta]